MLDSVQDNRRDEFRAAIERAQAVGLSNAEMQSMITATVVSPQTNGSTPETQSDDAMYEPGELPDGLIDLPSASKKLGISVVTLRSWVQRGKLPRHGRVRAKSPGGGYIVVREADIEYCRDHPLKTGRKKRASS